MATRADYLMWHEDRLYAVFTSVVSPHRLNRIAARLGRIEGVKAQVSYESFTIASSHHQGAVHLVWLAAHHEVLAAAARKMKQLVQPLLPYTLQELHVQLLECSTCHRLYLAATGSFVPGLGPDTLDSMKAFWSQLSEAFARTPLRALLPNGLDSSFRELADALDGAVRALGAYPSRMDIRPVKDPRPCRHRPRLTR